MSFLSEFFSAYPAFFKPNSKILLACSGGPDSVALAYALAEFQPQSGFEVEIAHINHKLRGKSSEKDAMFVADLSKRLGWRCHVVTAAVRPLRSGNLEEAARERRYAALLKIAVRRGCAAVFTAHTLDDQVETVLMNMMRGSGIDGLSGIAPSRPFPGSTIALCRPLLGVAKAELQHGLRCSHRQFRIDKSNRNQAFFRNWVRGRLVPMMERKAPGFKNRIKTLAEIALDEKKHWDREIGRLEATLLKPFRGGRLLDLKGLLRYSPAVQRRFLRRALGRDLLSYAAIEGLRNWMRSSPTGGRLWQLRKGWSVERLSKSKGSPSTQMFWFKCVGSGKDKFHS